MTECKPGLCVLITNAFIRDWTGSEIYVRDVAMELIKRGYKPIVYSPYIGELAVEFRKKSIPVVTDLNSIGVKPDLIHGQHHLEMMTALAHFPGTPAVFFCHGWLPWEETPPFHPRIIRYVTVSDALHDRLVYECGIPAEKVTTILNSVDLERFRPRPPLPAAPRRALVFNSHALESNILGIVREACDHNDIVLDVMGYSTGNEFKSPEALLGKYDIIFAVGRSALEGLATGAAVICCGLEGAGQLVTTQNMERLRRNNFGIRILDRPLNTEILSAEIQRYDPLDAQKVSQYVRGTAGLGSMVDQILGVYTDTLNGWLKNYPQDPTAEILAFSTYLKEISDKVNQAMAERDFANERARVLQAQVMEKELSMQAPTAKVAEKEQSGQLLTAKLAEIINSKAWKIALLLRRIQVWIAPPNGRRARGLQRLYKLFVFSIINFNRNRKLDIDMALIRTSGLFDENWYLSNNPDVVAAKIDPVRHYLLFGGFEGRDPGPQFSSNWYLATYDDVRKAGINPLHLYLKSGRKEGRATQAAQVVHMLSNQ